MLNKADHIIGVTKPEGGISNVIDEAEPGGHREVAEESRFQMRRSRS